MREFTDTAGRAWTIALTLGSALKVKARLGVDLLQPESGDPPLLTRLGTDEIFLGEVLCALLEEQFESRKITEDDVRDAFDGKTMLDAQTAFYDELIDFFRSRGRHDRQAAVAKQKALVAAGVERAKAMLESVDVDAAISGAMSGSSPA